MIRKEKRTDLKRFVQQNFELPEKKEIDAPKDIPIEDYIHESWSFLKRTGTEDKGTYIGLKNPYIVPGGRFRETYYWDAYFTMLGLQKSGKTELLSGMVENFADLTDKYGFIPNGNRTYYLSRSQPPFFGEMLKLLEQEKGFSKASELLPKLEKEYSFWMEPGRAVELQEATLNRYWDERKEPRPESYSEDLNIKKKSGRDEEIFRDIRAACESGWDFSTRWTKGEGLENIHTTDFLPVDLNVLLYSNEKQLGEWNKRKGDSVRARKYLEKADERKKAFNKIFWDEEKEFYFDYDIEKQGRSDSWTLAAVFPLYFGLASEEQADKVAETLEEKFLEEGGLKTTLSKGLQWDSPNGWPPLQYLAVKGLLRYEKKELARKICSNWLETCEKVYSERNVLLEKYNVVDRGEDVKEGEYDNQVGFGWTNGIYLALKDLDI
ncbi:MAG: trehalase family glycosidase [Candidatus Nanohalobium sp.]